MPGKCRNVIFEPATSSHCSSGNSMACSATWMSPTLDSRASSRANSSTSNDQTNEKGRSKALRNPPCLSLNLTVARASRILFAVDVLVTDPITGKRRGLAATVRRALAALGSAELPFCVIGATALAVRGLPRMTRDLDVAVMLDDAPRAWEALGGAGLRASTPLGTPEDPESMVVFVDPKTKVEVDLLVAAGDPEATAIDHAEHALVFGVRAPVATLEHLLLLYLYSNQPKHLGDFAAIVQSKLVDLTRAERSLSVMHPEMLGDYRKRVDAVRSPAPAPARPPPKRR